MGFPFMFPFFRDIDELVLACRSQRARSYLAEAVSCYKSGAFRACIVATWIAVVNDIVDKLRELADSGDKNALKKIEELTSSLEQDPIQPAQKFEREILDTVKNEFEFFTEHELFDLKRLREDRNRCAHPSFFVDGGDFVPSAELARYHLRHSVDSVLSQQPVQGKAVLEHLMKEVDSHSFPKDAADVIQLYKLAGHALVRAKKSLISNFIRRLFKELIDRFEDIDERGISNRVNALNAIQQLHPDICDEVFRDLFASKTSRIEDDKLLSLLHFVAKIADAWHYIPEVAASRIRHYLRSVSKDKLVPCLLFSLKIEKLNDEVEELINRLTPEDLIRVINAQPDPRMLRRVLSLCEQVQGIEDVDHIARSYLIPYVSNANLNSDQVQELIRQLHDQVLWTSAPSSSEVFNVLLDKLTVDNESRKEIIQRYALSAVLNRRWTPQSRDDVPF